jgi:hypothetical protein
MRKATRGTRDERGATLAFVAVALTGLVGMAALAVDLGMLIKSREDMQRAAEAAALAGATAFIDGGQEEFAVVEQAHTRALAILDLNRIGTSRIETGGASAHHENGHTYVGFAEGQIEVIPLEEKVRVFLRRPAVGTWFARILGRDSVAISAKAAAIAAQTGATKCVAPFAIPDLWEDADDDRNENDLEDLRISEERGEEWAYEPGDDYTPWDGNDDGTGYGSSYRNGEEYGNRGGGGAGGLLDDLAGPYENDYGRPVVLRGSSASDSGAVSPSLFQPWVLPGSEAGTGDYVENLTDCNPVEVRLGEEYAIDHSADPNDYSVTHEGPTADAINELVSQDPEACWNSDYNWVGRRAPGTSEAAGCNEPYPGWYSSPRVLHVPLFDPSQLASGGSSIRFNNFAVLFLERRPGDAIAGLARFLYFAKGTPYDSTTGPLTKRVRLVE